MLFRSDLVQDAASPLGVCGGLVGRHARVTALEQLADGHVRLAVGIGAPLFEAFGHRAQAEARARPELMTIFVMLFIFGTFGLNFPIFISTMAVQVFHTDAHGFGLLTSVMAGGTVVGAVLAAGRERPRFFYLLVSATVFGLGCALGCFVHTLWATLGIGAVVMASEGTFTTLKMAGAAYLVYIGIMAWSHAGKLEVIFIGDSITRHVMQGLFGIMSGSTTRGACSRQR